MTKDEMEKDAEIPKLTPCCGARRNIALTLPPPLVAGTASDELRQVIAASMVGIPAGFFDMGAYKPQYPVDFEGPRRKVFVSDFALSETAVTNALYAQFIEESGYRTVAEVEGWSYVFCNFLADPTLYPNSPPGTPWWRQVHGATWKTPEGPESSIEGRQDHPVTHVAWYDAVAFCAFTRTRLPTEAQWEKAARGDLLHKLFPWGNRLVPTSGHRHNVWQGEFPTRDTGDDGYAGTCPIKTFPPNKLGMYNMTGNVWEMCDDWFGSPQISRWPAKNPTGPPDGDAKVLKGGSFLCHASYCERYQVHSRSPTTPDSSTSHAGFRIAA